MSLTKDDFKNLEEIFATKSDLGVAKAELRTEMGSMKAELRAEMGSMKAELRAEMGSMKAELRSEMGSMKAELRSEIKSVKDELSFEILSVKNDLKEFKEETGEKLNLIIGMLEKDATAQDVHKAEHAANVGAHDRFETRITRTEKKLNLEPIYS